MVRLILSLFATALCMGAAAQSIEELTSYEDTFHSKLSNEQRSARFKARNNKGGAITYIKANEPIGKFGLDILPDTLYAGEPFDIHYSLPEEHTATYELYDRRGKRPKLMASKQASTPLSRGSAVLRFTINEPGEYEIAAYNNNNVMRDNFEATKSRWEFVVHERRDGPK